MLENYPEDVSFPGSINSQLPVGKHKTGIRVLTPKQKNALALALRHPHSPLQARKMSVMERQGMI